MNLVKQYREKKGITQGELGIRCSTTGSYISELERGPKVPSVYLAIKIAKALKVKVETLFPEVE